MRVEGAAAGPTRPKPDREEITQNVLAGLTTSFAAIALGAAFGDACGRGALVGILSAGMIALVTATLGGTRVQCSGPTAPMTTVTTTIVAYSRSDMFTDITTDLYNASSPGCDPDHYDVHLCPLPDKFVNIVMLLCGGFMLLLGVCGIGKYISMVPNVVISGFMNGVPLPPTPLALLRLLVSVLLTQHIYRDRRADLAAAARQDGRHHRGDISPHPWRLDSQPADHLHHHRPMFPTAQVDPPIATA
jgi:hypothetical protein